MNFSLKELKTANSRVVEILGDHGVVTTNQLLRAAAGVEARKTLAVKTGIEPGDLLALVNRADLARIKGIGPVFSDLLEYSGVDTVVELSRRIPAHLHVTCMEKAESHYTRRVPRPDEVDSWVAQAKELNPVVIY